MECFRIIETGEGIGETVRQKLSGRGGLGERCASGGSHPALLVVSPKAAEGRLALPEVCRTVLFPGQSPEKLVGLRAASAVSYGLSPRDSLTLSSREGDRLWAALQRELVTVEGQVVERQEFPLPRCPGGEELSALAAAGTLLLLGVPPEELA